MEYCHLTPEQVREVAETARRKQGTGELAVAVPATRLDGARAFAREVETLYCADIRTGPGFAVADACRQWHDVSGDEAAAHI